MVRTATERRRVDGRKAMVTACSIAALTLSAAPQAWAQEAQEPAPPPAPEQTEIDEPRIVVIGNRAIVAALEDVPVEQTYDEDRVASYAVSTLSEVLNEIRSENGDADPTVLVNGQPVSDLGDIADLPVEAIARIEALPRGSAQRVGGVAGQRAYNVVLRRSVKSATVTLGREVATEGGWGEGKGELLLNYIAGQDRIGLTLRASDSDALFESERDSFTPRVQRFAFSPFGNIIPVSQTPDAQVDPALSALVGRPVTIVALPLGSTIPSLAELASGANLTNPNQLSYYRSLRGAARPYQAAIAGNKTLTPWLSLSFNGRLNWSQNTSYSGLPSARFLIPASNPSTPFSVPVYLALSDRSRPLLSVSDTSAGSFSATLNGTFARFRATVVGRYDERERTYVTDSAPGSSIAVDSATNPFDGSLAGSIPVTVRTSHSKSTTSQLAADVEGPVFGLPAGALWFRAGLGIQHETLDANDTSGDRSFRRHQLVAKGGITIPLTGRDPAFLPGFGSSDIAFDIAWVELGKYGTLERHSAAFNWQPIPMLRLAASEVYDERAIQPELLAAPTVITPNVPYFDPLTGETVDVTTIYGGVAAVDNEEQRTRTLSLTASPLPKYNLQLDAAYLVTDISNQLGALPPPSTAVATAFPDRFQRDAGGTLILVDNRSVNFARQHSRQLRLGVGFTIPLTEPVNPPRLAGAPAPRRILPIKLQVNASHTYLLEDTTVIREGLPQIDLLNGGGIGFGGGRQRHATQATVAVTQGGTGFRLSARQRGVNFLTVGTLSAPDLLTFDRLFTVDLKIFADLAQLMPNNAMAKDVRFTIGFENLTNERQRVTNSLGATPLSYQPVYRDPIGRTVMVELRKIF
jgi:iron complex outermembrane receptor protein